MTDIKTLVQITLDNELYTKDNIYTFWKRMADLPETLNEYIVFTIGGLGEQKYADNKPLAQNTNVTVKYYYNITNRTSVTAREQQILKTMLSAGFTTTTGAFDLGDIDGKGYDVTGFEFSYGSIYNG